MAILFGYGEDALTLRALSVGLATILDTLRDGSDAAQALVFFRPSFGRSGPGNGHRSAQFGEFDAIIGTPNAVYLCEAKWKFTGDCLHLNDEQKRRHRVFRKYLEEYRHDKGQNWAEFEEIMRPILIEIDPFLDPAPGGSNLERNLSFILERLDNLGTKIVDVLLFLKLSETYPEPKKCGDFCVVPYACNPEGESNFVRLPNIISQE